MNAPQRIAPLPAGWLRKLAIAASLLLFAAARAEAQFPGDVPDTFRLNLGGMYAWFTTQVTFQENLTPGGPIGAGINMEDLLNVPSSTGGFTARGYWQPLRRFYVDFGYNGFSRSNTKTISQDITFGDTTYLAGASVTGSMKSELPYVDLRYNLIDNDSVKFGLSLGAAYALLQADLTASAGIVGPNGPIVGQTVQKEAKASVPVPLLGFLFDAKLSDRVSAGVIFDGIFAPVHPYVGSVFLAEAHVDWFLSKNIGLGGAFQYTKFNIKKEETNTFIDFSYSYYGPKAYVIVTF